MVALALLWGGSLIVTSGQSHPSLIRNHPAIAYSKTPGTDPVARLNERLRTGDVTLEKQGPAGFLASLLTALDVPVESQVLVFSKTSFQASKINPSNPRAIYFNDTTSIGWVRTGSVLELVSQDPRQGAIFYTLDQADAKVPQFERNDACVACHVSEATQNVPGLFIGSVFPDVNGITMYGPAYTTDHRTPFEMRWGGWFVTGTHRAERHMGNAIATNPFDLGAMVTPETVHVSNLEGRFDLNGYLSHSSDIVALLVLEHQVQMMNFLTRVGWETRIGDSAQPLDAAVVDLVDYLLFVDEAPLPGPISGPTAFAKTFSARGPRDRQGRSLRDLDLTRRLLKYPCSYLIYSEAFDSLPPQAREAIYRRLWDVLTGRATEKRYEALGAADRTAIIEILRDTKKDLPDYWNAA